MPESDQIPDAPPTALVSRSSSATIVGDSSDAEMTGDASDQATAGQNALGAGRLRRVITFLAAAVASPPPPPPLETRSPRMFCMPSGSPYDGFSRDVFRALNDVLGDPRDNSGEFTTAWVQSRPDGCGKLKTYLYACFEYERRVYDYVLWVAGGNERDTFSSLSQVAVGLSKLVDNLKVPDAQASDPKKNSEELYRWLEGTEQTWLIIYEGVPAPAPRIGWESYRAGFPFCPCMKRGRAIILSPDAHDRVIWNSNGRTIPAESVEFRVE